MALIKYIFPLEFNSQCESDLYQWSQVDKGDYIKLQEGTLKFIGTEIGTQRSLVRTIQPLPSSACKFYVEARVIDRGSGTISIGLTTSSPESRNLHIPGKDPGAIGISCLYWQNTGESAPSWLYYGQSSPVEENIDPISTNDVLGCHVESIVDNGILSAYRLCSFTINGNPAGQPRYLEDHELFPTIMLNSPGAIVETNFGQKQFIHDAKGNSQNKHFVELCLH